MAESTVQEQVEKLVCWTVVETAEQTVKLEKCLAALLVDKLVVMLAEQWVAMMVDEQGVQEVENLVVYLEQ